MNSTIAPPRPDLIQAAIETLKQGEILLQEISDETYTRKVESAYNASIGGHVRHCLDHFRSLIESTDADELNYDHRERGTLVENDRFAALNSVRELIERCQRLDAARLSRTLNVTCKTSYASAGSQTSPSTIGREIMYCVAHAVHHFALIGVMASVLGVKLPLGFGVAPSTLKHQAESNGTPAHS